jgi:methyl-accepting chemotaxis protein
LPLRRFNIRVLAPLVGAILLLWLLAGVTYREDRAVEAANVEALEAQERVLAVAEVRSVSRSLQRDALNLITETDPAERAIIVKKFDDRSAQMREMLRHLEDTKARHILPEDYFRLSHTVIAALGEVAAQANAGNREAALNHLRKAVRPAERAASKVADAQIDTMNAEVAALRHTAAVAQRAANRTLLVAVIFLSLLAVAVGALTEMIRREQARLIVRNIGSGLHKLAGGDLTARIDAALVGDFSKLKSDFNHAAEALGTALATVRRSATDIAAGAEELLQSSNDLSDRTERQAASLEETAGALQQLSGALNDSASNAVEVRKVIKDAHLDAEQSGNLLKEAMTAIHRLEEFSNEIAEILLVIDRIAFQTNLLALNAGVEAARAGEAGKGFAVVAQEVRALAGRSAEAAMDVKRRIGRSSEQIVLSVRSVGNVEGALGRLIDRVGSVATLSVNIAENIEQQSLALQQITSAVAELDSVTQQNAAVAEEESAAARKLVTETQMMTGQIEQFRFAEWDAANDLRPDLDRPARVVWPQRAVVTALKQRLPGASDRAAG